jgi:hypothetical protein
MKEFTTDVTAPSNAAAMPSLQTTFCNGFRAVDLTESTPRQGEEQCFVSVVSLSMRRHALARLPPPLRFR